MNEPEDVRLARATIRAYRMRHGHASYVECLDGGQRGYQAECWDCDWAGPERLCGDEPMSTPESRAHKQNARADAAAHQRETRPDDWRDLVNKTLSVTMADSGGS